MKKVFSSNSEVCHVFAQRTHTEGRCGGAVYFHYDKLYSYGSHYILAEFLDDETVMINDRGYSSSTGKHIGLATSALRHYKCFRSTNTDIDLVYNQVMIAKDKLGNARKPEMYINEILSLWRSLKEFAEWKRVKNKIAKTKFGLYKSDKYKEIRRLVDALLKDSEGMQARLKVHALSEAKKKRAKDKRDLKIAIQEFEAYERRSFRIGDKDFLRVSEDGEDVETSQGISVTVKEARLLYAMIKANRDIKGHRIGYYTVTSINGTLKIGCHSIDIDSMHKVGAIISK